MNAFFQKRPLWLLGFFLALTCFARLDAQDTDRVYSMSEVATIDREQKLWRRVDAAAGIEANLQHLLAAGISVSEVERFKPWLIQLWGDMDPSLQIDWLDQKTLTKLQSLKLGYVIPMRQARIDDELYRLGGEKDWPMTSDGVMAQWRGEIWSLLDGDQRDDFTLMNSARSIALCHLTKDLPTTVQERLTLCRLQREYYSNTFSVQGDKPTKIIINGKKALLNYWQNMRDLLGDERFATYMRKSDAGFGRTSFVLDQIAEVSNKMILDLWWIRKKDELDDAQPTSWEISWYQRKMKVYDSATAVLGSSGMTIYLGDDDSKWLRRKPTARMIGFRIAMEKPEFPKKPE